MMSENNNKFEFTSFSRKRFLIMAILLIVVVINYLVFGVELGRHIPTGSIFSFEGPSYFFTSGLVPALVGIFLLLYCIFSYFKGTIIDDGNTISLSEKRYHKKYNTKLEKSKIERMYLTNNEVGIKYLWIFLFVPYIIINYYYMMVNFLQPFIVGIVNITAVPILISIILSTVAFVILYAFPQWYLRIYTDEGVFELWFEPRRKDIEQIAKKLGIITREREETIDIKPLKNLNTRNVIFATMFLAYGIFNVVMYMTTLAIFQTFVCYFLVIMGVYLLSGELKRLPLPAEGISTENARFNLKSRYYQQYLYIKKTEKSEVAYNHIDFEVFWGICTGAVFVAVIFKITQLWMVLNSVNITILLDNAISMTLIGGGILFLIRFHILVPQKALSIRSDAFTINSSFLKKGERESKGVKEALRGIKEAFKQNFNDPILRKKFKKRMICILIASLLGIVVLMWEYFFYFNLFNIFNI